MVFKHFGSATQYETLIEVACWLKIKIINNLILIAQILGLANIKNQEDVNFYFIQCAASSTPKDPQVKTTEPMVTNCSIQLC